MSVKNWCFTWNNYEGLIDFDDVSQHVRYLVYQEEVGENGTPHLQGFLQLNDKQRLSFMKKLFDDTVHWEPCRDPEKARKYCKKEDSRVGGPYEFGEFVTQGHRTDADRMHRRIKEGATRDEIIEEFPSNYMRYSNGIDKMIDCVSSGVRPLPKVVVYCGGGLNDRMRMLSSARNQYPSHYFVPDTKQWGGYKGQECLIFKGIPKDWGLEKIQWLCSDLPFEIDRKFGHSYITSSVFFFVLEEMTIFDDVDCDDMKIFFCGSSGYVLLE